MVPDYKGPFRHTRHYLAELGERMSKVRKENYGSREEGYADAGFAFKCAPEGWLPLCRTASSYPSACVGHLSHPHELCKLFQFLRVHGERL